MASKPLRDWRRLPGTSRKYIKTKGRDKGRVISRYEYDSIRARRLGYRNYGEAQRFRKSSSFRSWRRRAKEEDPRRDTGWSSQFARNVHEVQQQREAGADDDIVNDPDGALANILVAVGARRPGWDWNVGDTPKGNRSR